MQSKSYLYGLEDRPPIYALLVLSLQHAVLALLFLVYPLAVAQELAMDGGSTLAFLNACVVGIGIATCLHYFRTPVGSGSLAIEIPTPLFLPTAVIAGGVGGISAISGISLICGMAEVVFARSLRHIRALFPAEICGIAVLMLGISIIHPGMLNALDLSQTGGQVQWQPLLVSTATLVTIACVSVFAVQRFKIFALAAGVIVGVVLSIQCHLIGASEWLQIAKAPWLAFPKVTLGWPKFDLSLVPLAIVMGVAQSVDNLGMLVGIQRQIEPNWHQLNLRQASGGIQVSGIGDLVCGVLGGMPTGISSANVGLAHATGAVSRRIALVAGVLLLAAPFLPKIVIAFSLMPRPVIGAIVIYASVYMVVSGMSLMLRRVLNDRRIFVIGLSVVLGLTSAVLPGAFQSAPTILRPFLESPLAVSTVAGILLTQLFRIGAVWRRGFTVDLPATQNESLQEARLNQTLRQQLERLAAEIGADKPFIDRAIDVTSELLAAMQVVGCIEGNVRFAARIEDARLEISLLYEGLALPAEVQGDRQANIGSRDNSPLLNLLRICRHVDRIASHSTDGQQKLTLIYQA